MKKIMLILLACFLCISLFDGKLIQAKEEEFVNTYQDVEEDVPTSTFEDEVEVTTSSNLPARYDSRDYGWVTSVKSQGSLGTCWAFTTVGAAETSLLKQGYVSNANQIDLNELQLAYGFYHRVNDPLNLTPNDFVYETSGDYLMRGGNIRVNAMYLAQWGSLVNQADFPYATDKNQIPNNLHELYNYKDTDYIMKDSINLPEEERAIKEAIIEYGSVGASYYSLDGSNKTYIFHDDSNQASNHAVLLVGYDDTISRNLFKNSHPQKKLPSRDGAWIVKNSWGSYNGDNGYYYLSYDMHVYTPTAFVFQPRSTYDHNYFYDGGYILNQANPWSQEVMRVANVFTSKKGDYNTKETLEAVNVGIGSANTNYSIMIYQLEEGQTNPLSSKKLLSKPVKGFVKYPGNYTIDLNKSIELEEGSKFSVEVTLSTTTNELPSIFISQTYQYSWLYVYEEVLADQCYLIYDDSYVYDAVRAGYCARIRAYTNTSSRKNPLPKQVKNVKAKAIDYKTIQLTWDKTANAKEYVVYRKSPSSDSFSRYKTTTKTSQKVTVTSGKQYQFYVRAYNDYGRGAKSDIVKKTAKLTGTPTLELTKKGKTRFQLKWSAVDGATRYIIYRQRGSGNYRKVLTLGGDVFQYTTTYLPQGTYRFIVKAARYDSIDRVMTNNSNEVKGTSTYTRPELTVKKEGTSANLTWTKVEGVQYYHVYRSSSKDGKYSHIKTTTSTNYQNKSLSKGKTYYFKIRGYKSYDGENIYTKFSPIRSIKI